MAQALTAVEKERDKLAADLQQAKHATQTAAQLAEMTRTKDLQEAAATKDAEIQALKAKLRIQPGQPEARRSMKRSAGREATRRTQE